MPESLVFSHAKISLIPCFLTFWSTEVDPYSLFKFLIILVYTETCRIVHGFEFDDQNVCVI